MHEQFLLAALEQAKQGRGICSPNPSVGAVAVQNGCIIARAWHRGAGTAHAEQLLLAQITPKMPGINLYITLEPCNHWGRTPPCVDAIIQHGIEHVVFACHDPNPVVIKNHSTDTLESHGVKVSYFPIPEINDFYQSYRYWTRTGKPRVTVKIAQSLDGKVGRAGGPKIHLSNESCQQFTHQMRTNSDIILTSAKTIQTDNPQMNVRLEGEIKAKPVAIVDRRLSLSTEAVIFSTASHCHVYHQSEKAGHYPNSSFYTMPCTKEGIDLEAVLKHLGHLGYHDVWVEAGGALFSTLHRENLVHRTYLYLVSKVLGPKAVSAYAQEDIFDRAHKISWHAMDNNMIARLDWQEDECLPG